MSSTEEELQNRLEALRLKRDSLRTQFKSFTGANSSRSSIAEPYAIDDSGTYVSSSPSRHGSISSFSTLVPSEGHRSREDISYDGFYKHRAPSTASTLSRRNTELLKAQEAFLDEEKARLEEADHQQHLDLIFLVDCTASMTRVIKAVATQLLAILDLLAREFSNVETQVAFVGYRDIGDREQFVIEDFQDPEIIRPKIEAIQAKGGGDTAEDVLTGYEKVLGLLRQRNRGKRHRCLLHFLDAPPHGQRFHGKTDDSHDRFWRREPALPHKPSTWLEDCVKELCGRKVFCNMFMVTSGTVVPTDLITTRGEFATAFDNVPYGHGREKFTATPVQFSGGSATGDVDRDVKAFVEKVLKAVIDSLSLSGAKKT